MIEEFESFSKDLKKYLEYIETKMNISTIHTENGFKVYYPSSKAIKDGIEKSMS